MKVIAPQFLLRVKRQLATGWAFLQIVDGTGMSWCSSAQRCLAFDMEFQPSICYWCARSSTGINASIRLGRCYVEVLVWHLLPGSVVQAHCCIEQHACGSWQTGRSLSETFRCFCISALHGGMHRGIAMAVCCLCTAVAQAWLRRCVLQDVDNSALLLVVNQCPILWPIHIPLPTA